MPDDVIVGARQIATKHVRGDRIASLVWAVISGVGLLVFLGFCIGGSFNGHAVAAGIAIGVIIILSLFGTLQGVVQETRMLASLPAPPRQLRLISRQRRRTTSDRLVELHDGPSVVATARMRRPRPLTSLSVPIAVLVFGEVTPGRRVVCVNPRSGLVATCKLE